jgi:hypothetical protein
MNIILLEGTSADIHRGGGHPKRARAAVGLGADVSKPAVPDSKEQRSCADYQ